jgi:hypothetical protein
VDRPSPDPARIAEIDALLDRSDPRPARERVALLFERAELMVLLDRAGEAIDTLQRIMELATPGSPPELRIGAARALRMWIELSEESASGADVPTRVARIDVAIADLPPEPMRASQQTAGDLLVEKALLLDRAGQESDVEQVLDDLITRFADTDDPVIATSAAWAFRNRIARALEAGSRDRAIAAAERLAALYARVWLKPTPAVLNEHLAAVWKLLMEQGLEQSAERLIGPLLDRSNAVADKLLLTGRAQLLVHSLLAARRLGDQHGAERAMTELHALGEPALTAIDAAVAQRTAALAILLLQRVPLLVGLNRTADARATLDQIEQLLASNPDPELRDVVTEVRAEFDNDASRGERGS